MPQLTVNNTILNFVEQGTGAPLLLVHGFPLDHQMWKGQINALARDFHVIAPDLRGFGNSESSADIVTMEDFSDDLAELLNQLGITQRVALCGLSMGGYIAWQFWRRHADRLSRLVLCDTRAAADSVEAARGREDLAAKVMQQGSVLLALEMIPKLFSERTRRERPSVVTATEEVIRKCRPLAASAALRGMAQRADATSWLGQINVPVLVVVGQEDALTGVDEMKSIADALPQSEFAVIANCGHMAPLEDPTRVNDIMRKFLL